MTGGHTTTVVVAALIGVAAGPALAALTSSDRQQGGWRWLTGHPTSPPRRVTLAGLAGLACGLVAAGIGPAASLPAYLCLALAGAALTVTDIEQRRLPNRIVGTAAAAGLLGLTVAAVADRDGGRLGRALLAALVVGVVLAALWWLDPAGLGFGDVKTSAMIGLFLGYAGWGQLIAALAGGFVLTALAALALAAAGRVGRGSALPFAPALVTATLAVLATT